MPGWHEKTKRLQAEGRLQMVGIIEEQHPDRTALFMQWKRMEWPILVDALNLLEVTAVPLTYLVDEHGVIRYERPSDADLEAFLAAEYPPPTASSSGRDGADPAVTSFLWGDAGELDSAIDELRSRAERDPADGWSRFRLGVALRKRYDSPGRRVGDFGAAVDQWSQALALDPNQYIWRRRIQQYGPRLDKPYPFYDWVHEARAAIEARGETPSPLVVEPRGAEFAAPVEAFEADGGLAVGPDPEGRIFRDEAPLIRAEVVVVPGAIEPTGSARVHVELRPDLGKKAHWNNEVDDLIVWVDPPEGFGVDRRLHRVRVPQTAVSQETRAVEFEIESPPEFTGRRSIPAYALYYVCEDVDGTCLFRRQDLEVELRARTP